MPAEYKEWVLTPAEQQKFQDWMSRILVGHTGTRDIRNQEISWTPLGKPLSQAVVTLVTTGGVHRESDPAFDIANPHGDWSFREIPTDLDTRHLAITHTHYNHVDADRDINCMFPLDRLRELCDQGVIGGIAPTGYSIMGFIPDPQHLVSETAPELARRVRDSGADLALMTCGWPICHRSVGLVQNQIEGAGVSTISMTVQPHITGSVGVPRAVYLRFPAGNQLGEAGKPQQQRAIITAALEAVAYIQRPGTIVELPYRWRRFPVEETPQFMGTSQGPRHPQAEAIGEALDQVVRLANEYKSSLEARLAREIVSPTPIPGLANALRTQIGRVDHLIKVLDTDALDTLRETVNSIATLELRASGKFV